MASEVLALKQPSRDSVHIYRTRMRMEVCVSMPRCAWRARVTESEAITPLWHTIYHAVPAEYDTAVIAYACTHVAL